MKYFNLYGIFYSIEDGLLEGSAELINEKYWRILLDNDKEIYRYYIYLDSYKKILAPKKYEDIDECKKISLAMINKYEKYLKDTCSDEMLKKVSPSHNMSLSIARSYVLEYKRIYRTFLNNSMLYILDDWLDEE